MHLPTSPRGPTAHPATHLLALALFVLAWSACGVSETARAPQATPAPIPTAAVATITPAQATPTAMAPGAQATPGGTAARDTFVLPTPDAKGQIVVPFPTMPPQFRSVPTQEGSEDWPPVHSVQEAITALQERSGLTVTVVPNPEVLASAPADEYRRLEFTADGQLFTVNIERCEDLESCDVVFAYAKGMELKGYYYTVRSSDGLILVTVAPQPPDAIYYAIRGPIEAE